MTKENIIIAALRLFLARGYKSVSLIDVANELGMTKGGIYHYFSSKDDLLHAALHFFLDRLEAKYAVLLDDKESLQDLLHSLLVENTFEVYSKELLGVNDTCSIDYIHFAIEIIRLFPDIQERVYRNNVYMCESLAGKIQAAIDQRQVRADLDSCSLAVAIMAMLNGRKSLGMYFQAEDIRKRIFDSIWVLIRS